MPRAAATPPVPRAGGGGGYSTQATVTVEDDGPRTTDATGTLKGSTATCHVRMETRAVASRDGYEWR